MSVTESCPAAQVGNWTAEADYWGRIEDITAPQATYSTAVVNGSSDIGGQVCALPACTAQLLSPSTCTPIQSTCPAVTKLTSN